MKSILSEPISVPKITCLWNNPWIALQNSPVSWHTWTGRGIEVVDDLIIRRKFLSWMDLQK